MQAPQPSLPLLLRQRTQIRLVSRLRGRTGAPESARTAPPQPPGPARQRRARPPAGLPCGQITIATSSSSLSSKTCGSQPCGGPLPPSFHTICIALPRFFWLSKRFPPLTPALARASSLLSLPTSGNCRCHPAEHRRAEDTVCTRVHYERRKIPANLQTPRDNQMNSWELQALKLRCQMVQNQGRGIEASVGELHLTKPRWGETLKPQAGNSETSRWKL